MNAIEFLKFNPSVILWKKTQLHFSKMWYKSKKNYDV